MIGWYVLATVVRKEPVAAARLASVGFETFLPKAHEMSEYGSKQRVISAPLFPGYLFAYGDPIEIQQRLALWRQMQIYTGIHKILSSSDNTPLPVDSDIVFHIKLNTLDTGYVDTDNLSLNGILEILSPGDRVWTLEGSGWPGHLGKVSSLKGPDRVRVLLWVLGAEREVEMDRRLLLKEEIIETT